MSAGDAHRRRYPACSYLVFQISVAEHSTVYLAACLKIRHSLRRAMRSGAGGSEVSQRVVTSLSGYRSAQEPTRPALRPDAGCQFPEVSFETPQRLDIHFCAPALWRITNEFHIRRHNWDAYSSSTLRRQKPWRHLQTEHIYSRSSRGVMRTPFESRRQSNLWTVMGSNLVLNCGRAMAGTFATTRACRRRLITPALQSRSKTELGIASSKEQPTIHLSSDVARVHAIVEFIAISIFNDGSTSPRTTVSEN